MEEEDWGKTADAPPFSLFHYYSPEEAIKKGGFVDPIVYTNWKKAERKLYMKLLTESIENKRKAAKELTESELCNAMDALKFMKKEEPSDDGLNRLIDDLQTNLDNLQIRSRTCRKKMETKS